LKLFQLPCVSPLLVVVLDVPKLHHGYKGSFPEVKQYHLLQLVAELSSSSFPDTSNA
jgi:hypothetical protein